MKVLITALVILIVFLTIVLICVVQDEENSTTEINAKLKQTNTSSDETSVGDHCLSLGCPEYTAFIGSKNSDKYHDCDSRFAKNILKENLVCFMSRNEAILKGYTEGDVK